MCSVFSVHVVQSYIVVVHSSVQCTNIDTNMCTYGVCSMLDVRWFNNTNRQKLKKKKSCTWDRGVQRFPNHFRIISSTSGFFFFLRSIFVNKVFPFLNWCFCFQNCVEKRNLIPFQRAIQVFYRLTDIRPEILRILSIFFYFGALLDTEYQAILISTISLKIRDSESIRKWFWNLWTPIYYNNK